MVQLNTSVVVNQHSPCNLTMGFIQSCQTSVIVSTDQFQCAHGKRCIERNQVCDGVSHCQDRSDELECSKKMEGCDHQCDEKSRCIPESFLCDGESDCQDGSDETNCGTMSLNQETRVLVFDQQFVDVT